MTLAAALLTAREYAIACNADTTARATAEGWTFYTLHPEDEAYWAEQAAEYGIVTGADVIRRDAIQCYSDTYKEVHGIRPRWVSFDDIETDKIGEMLTALQAEASELASDDTDEDVDADEDMSLTEREEDEDLYRTLPSHLIQAWGL